MKKLIKISLSFLIIFFLLTIPLFAIIVSEKGIGEQKVLVIMVKFPDVKSSFSKDDLREKYFFKLNRYLKAISYNKSWIKGKMTDWYILPHKVAYYRLSQHNLEVEKERVINLIQDAVNLADKDEDFSQYSMIFISLGSKKQYYGMMGLCGYPGMLGWKNQFQIKTKIKKQEIPNGVAIYCENAHIGVVFHDMAHIMGGVQKGRRILPCLYDHDLQAQKGSFRNSYQFYLVNVGFFDPMSCHFYKLNQGPPGVCAWTKLRLNWIEPQKIVEINKGESKTLLIDPLSRGNSKVQAVKLPISSSTYYLIENRQSIGPDKNLPSHGIIIYSCDDRVIECRNGKSPVKVINANPSIPQLKGAPFTCKGESIYKDEKHNIFIKLIDQNNERYKIFVSNNGGPY